MGQSSLCGSATTKCGFARTIKSVFKSREQPLLRTGKSGTRKTLIERWRWFWVGDLLHNFQVLRPFLDSFIILGWQS